MTKKFNSTFTLICVFVVFWSVVLSGCSSTITPSRPVTTAQTAVASQEKKLEKTLDKMDKNEELKISQTSTLSHGVQYSLMQVTNPTSPVKTAQTLNDRIISIVGTPNLEESKRIKATVDLLNAELEKERKKGETLLADRDKIISNLQKQNSDLKQQYDDDLWKMSDKAKEVAKTADQNKSVLDSMSGMFGLNAVFWGIKKFFFSCLTGIIIFGVIFLILRVLAAINPIAGAAFSIFNILGTGALSIIKGLTPKAFEMANFTSNHIVDAYKTPLIKIVDVIQDLKEKQKHNSTLSYSLNDILEHFEKEMNDSDKSLIKQILVDQKWKV